MNTLGTRAFVLVKAHRATSEIKAGAESDEFESRAEEI
jgi:hypothetical protein